MEIVVLNKINSRIDLIHVPKRMITSNVENFLKEHGYNLDDTENISWMMIEDTCVSVQFHHYSISNSDFEEVHKISHGKLKDNSVVASLYELKNREQRNLAQWAMINGKEVEDGFIYVFDEADRPIIAGYDPEKPNDITIVSVKVSKDGKFFTIKGMYDGDNEVHKIAVDDFFAGQLTYIYQNYEYKDPNFDDFD